MTRTSRTSTPVILWLTVAAASVAATAGAAHAGTQTCERVADDVITADGLTDDWSGIGAAEVGPRARDAARDASFKVRCAYDTTRLHVVVEVLDDYLYRGKKPSARKDDHLVVDLRMAGKKSDRLVVYPGNDKVERKRTFNRRKLPKWLQAEDAQVRRGWALEVTLPMARLRGYHKNGADIDAFIEYHDADYSARVTSKLAFDGFLTLQGADELYDSFMSAAKLSSDHITVDTMKNFDGNPGPERLIAGKDVIGILSDQYFFMRLPVAGPKDVLKVQVAALRPDGVHSIITELRQHGNGGSRDVLMIWQVNGDRLQNVLAVELRKEKGERSLSNRWSLAKRGKYRKGKRSRKGRDLVIEVADKDAKGWDEDNYFEQAATDVLPILTPWSDNTSAVYYFDGNTAQGGDPKPRKRRK